MVKGRGEEGEEEVVVVVVGVGVGVVAVVVVEEAGAPNLKYKRRKIQRIVLAKSYVAALVTASGICSRTALTVMKTFGNSEAWPSQHMCVKRKARKRTKPGKRKRKKHISQETWWRTSEK